MPQIPVTVDPVRLRAVADRVQAAADAVAEFGSPTPSWDELPGSAVARTTGPVHIQARLDDVIAGLTAWVSAVRSTAGALEDADEHSAGRM